MPDVTNVQVQILTNSPGLAPEEVERFISFPVETAMSGLPQNRRDPFGLQVRALGGHRGLRGRAPTSTGHDNWLASAWRRRDDQIPEGYGEPEMGPISTGLGEIYQFEVRGEPMCPPGETGDADVAGISSGRTPSDDGCYTPMELRTILDWFVNYQLRSVPGIVEVNSFGGELKTYQITLDPDRLVSYGLAVGDVFAAVEANNRNVGGGYIARGGEQYLIRGEGLIRDPGGSRAGGSRP